MLGGRLSQINMNNEGLIYLNNNLKINAIKVTLMQRLARRTQTLINKCQQCQSDHCIAQTQEEFEKFKDLKRRVETGVQKFQEEYGYDYHLCGQLIYDNDIKICRRKVKSKLVDQLKQLLTKELPQ